jgi:hypothetical protein
VGEHQTSEAHVGAVGGAARVLALTVFDKTVSGALPADVVDFA